MVPSLSAGVGEIIEVAMAKKRKNRYASAEDMLTDLDRVARGEPPLVARKAYDLESLADLEKTGTPVDGTPVQNGNGGSGQAVAEQHTIDIGGGRTMQQRLTDPIVLILGGALVIALLVILIMAISR